MSFVYCSNSNTPEDGWEPHGKLNEALAVKHVIISGEEKAANVGTISVKFGQCGRLAKHGSGITCNFSCKGKKIFTATTSNWDYRVRSRAVRR
jgi:hypothetical protein